MRQWFRDHSRFACQVLPIIAITAVAAALRFWAIGRLPPGLYRDEAQNGLDALRVLEGSFPIFFPANNGREPLFIYALAGGIALLGRQPLALRCVSALIGALTIPALYLLARSLFDHRMALVTAFLATFTVWTLNLSRVAFRVGLMVPIMAGALAALWLGLCRRRPAWMALAGVLWAAGLYTYLAARFSLLALPLFVLYLRLRRPDLLWWRGLALSALVGLLMTTPLVIYFVRHWDLTMGRASQVSIFNPNINQGDLRGTLLRHVWRVTAAFLWRGDFIPRHNVPLRPLFDPAIAVAFFAGLWVAWRRARWQAAYGLLLIWLAVTLLPTILAEDAFHMLRGAGVLPVLFMFPALGLWEGYRHLSRRGWPRVAGALLGAILMISATLNVRAYAGHLSSEEVYYQFESGATQMGAEINAFRGVGWSGYEGLVEEAPPPGGGQVYLAERLWRDWPSVRFLCPPDPALTLLGQEGDGLVGAEDDSASLVILWPYDDNRELLHALPGDRTIRVHEGASERGDLEPESRLLYVSYRCEPTVPDQVPYADWEEGIHLVNYGLAARQDSTVEVQLYWRADEEIEIDYTVFVHVLRDGAFVAGDDGPPAGGYYPTTLWRPGDVIEDRRVVALQGARIEDVQLLVGLYDLQTMERLSLLDESGSLGEATAYVLNLESGLIGTE